MIGYSGKAIRPLVLIMPKRKRYVKTFKVKDGNKDKNNKLMSFGIHDEKLSQKYKAIWTKTGDLKNIKWNALPVYDDRYIKTKTRLYGDKVYTNFGGLNVPKDDMWMWIFYSHFYWLFTCIRKQVLPSSISRQYNCKQTIDYLDDNLFED